MGPRPPGPPPRAPKRYAAKGSWPSAKASPASQNSASHKLGRAFVASQNWRSGASQHLNRSELRASTAFFLPRPPKASSGSGHSERACQDLPSGFPASKFGPDLYRGLAGSFEILQQRKHQVKCICVVDQNGPN